MHASGLETFDVGLSGWRVPGKGKGQAQGECPEYAQTAIALGWHLTIVRADFNSWLFMRQL